MKTPTSIIAICTLTGALAASVVQAQATDPRPQLQRQFADEEAQLRQQQEQALTDPTLTPEQREALVKQQREQLETLRDLHLRQQLQAGAARQSQQTQLPELRGPETHRQSQRFTRERQQQQLESDIIRQQQQYSRDAQSRHR